MGFCTNCGTQYRAGERFCSKRGKRSNGPERTQPTDAATTNAAQPGPAARPHLLGEILEAGTPDKVRVFYGRCIERIVFDLAAATLTVHWLPALARVLQPDARPPPPADVTPPPDYSWARATKRNSTRRAPAATV